MKILAIETSSHVASVAVVDGSKRVGEFTINHPKTHSQKLMPLLETLLSQVEMKMADFDYLAVSVGPGSFTGVRIGISAVKGLAHPLNLPIIPVSSLKAMAYPFVGFKGLICPVMDARKNEVYTGVYRMNGAQIETVLEETAMSPAELMALLKDYGETVLLLGDGMPKYEADFEEALGSYYMKAPIAYNRQSASSVAELALHEIKNAVRYDELQANYLRKSEAETTYEAKHGHE